MSVIEDSRKVLQDFIAPELRAIAARLDALEKRLDDRFLSLEKRLDQFDHRIDRLDGRMDRLEQKIEDVDARAERRHNELMIAVRQLLDLNAIHQRLAKLESRETPHQ